MQVARMIEWSNDTALKILWLKSNVARTEHTIEQGNLVLSTELIT